MVKVRQVIIVITVVRLAQLVHCKTTTVYHQLIVLMNFVHCGYNILCMLKCYTHYYCIPVMDYFHKPKFDYIDS